MAAVQTVVEAGARQTTQGDRGVKMEPPRPSTPRGQGEGRHAKVGGGKKPRKRGRSQDGGGIGRVITFSSINSLKEQQNGEQSSQNNF